MDNNEISKSIGCFLKENDDFLITAHHAPDGDNIGSSIGLYLALNQIGKKAVIVNEDKFVERYEFLFGRRPSPFIQYSDEISNRKFQNVIVLDTATFDRIGKVRNLISDDAAIVNIDHHPTNEMFGAMNFVEATAASASQLVFKILKDNGFDISKEVSDALLSGVLSDTGGLRFANTNTETIGIVKDLMSYGSDLADITDRIFMRLSYNETVKVSDIASKIILFKNEKIALAYNDQENNPLIENEPVLMILNSIEEAEVSLFVRRVSDTKIKISIRSKGEFNVSEFSAKWDGGGHKNAAGIKFNGTYKDFEGSILKELKAACLEYYEK